MAPQSSSGSVTTSTSAPSDTTSPDNGNGNPGMPGLNPSSSLPFSFLVTFIAIFLFFLGCGLGSRRVTRTLRRNLGLEVMGLDGGRRASRIPLEKPLLWDVFPREAPSVIGGKGSGGGFSHSWEDIAPVCATYVRTPSPTESEHALPTPASAAPLQPEPQTVNALRWPLGGTGYFSRGVMRSIPQLPSPPTSVVPPMPSRTADVPRSTAPEMRWRGRRVPDWIARPLMPDSLDGPQSGLAFDSAVRSESDEIPEEDKQVQALQIAVLVSMPSPERAYATRLRAKALEAERWESGSSGKSRAEVEVSSRGTIGEYVLGIARVPWKEGEMGGPK